MDIYSRVKELCSFRNITMYKLEKELGIGHRSFYNWQTSSPSVDKVMRVAEYFGVSLNYLLGLEEKRNEETVNSVSDEAMSVAKAFDKADTYTRLDVLKLLGMDKKRLARTGSEVS